MKDLVVELLGEKDNRWHGTVGQASEKWTTKEWRKVYGFSREGEGMASRTDRFIDSKFFGRLNPKDRYAIVDCKEPRARKELEFLVPLLYCRSTKTQVNPSSALNRIKHHQSNPSNVLGILDSNLSKRACVFS